MRGAGALNSEHRPRFGKAGPEFRGHPAAGPIFPSWLGSPIIGLSGTAGQDRRRASARRALSVTARAGRRRRSLWPNGSPAAFLRPHADSGMSLGALLLAMRLLNGDRSEPDVHKSLIYR